MLRRSYRNESFMKVIIWHKIDVCRFANDVNSYATSMFKGYLIYINETFKGVLHKCPYRDLSLTNLSMSLDSSFEIDTIIPNGENLVMIHLYNNRDPNIGRIEIIWSQKLVDFFL